MLQVAKVAGSKWLEVGVSLGFITEELNQYEEQEPKNLRRRLFCLLVDWKKEQKYPTVFKDIVFACHKAGVGGDVKRALEAPQFS